MSTINNNSPITTDNILSGVEGMKDQETGLISQLAKMENLWDGMSYFNSGKDGAEKIDQQIKALEDAIKNLQGKVEGLQKEINDATDNINKKGDKLAEIVNKINKETGDYQDEVKQAVKNATKNAIQEYNPNSGKPFEYYYKEVLGKNLKNLVSMDTIKGLYNEFDNVNSGISGLCSDIDGLFGKVGNLQGQLQNTNATIKLLETTKGNLSSTMKDVYQNIDTNSEAPKYSGDKEALVDSYFKKYTSRNEAAKTAKPDTKAVQSKWADKNTKKTDLKEKDAYLWKSLDNPELKNLDECLKAGMLEDLQANGMNNQQIMEFIAKNWNVGLVYDKKEKVWTIPKGHDNKNVKTKGAPKVYDKLRDFCNSKSSVTGASSVNQNQMAELKKAVEQDGILKEMYENGFTFKEAMYALTKLFPDAGITYEFDNNKQSTRNYGLVKDSSASGTLYEKIGRDVETYWNVGSSEAETKTDSSIKDEGTRYDPMVFKQGDTTYTFIVDRGNDGKFDYKDGKDNDLLGSGVDEDGNQLGIGELRIYDTDGDGVIKGDELKNVLIMANKQTESVDNSKDVDGYKDGTNYKGKGAYTNSVDFDISYSSAADLGITEINLNGIEENKNKEANINGSVTMNSFSLTMGGKEITVSETDNTEKNLETFYGSVAKSADTNSNKIYSKISHDDYEDAFKGWAVDGAEKLNDQLETMKDSLEALKDAQNKDDNLYSLNMSFEELQSVYGKDGTYLDEANKIGIAIGEQYKNDDTMTHNIVNQPIDKEFDKFNKSDAAEVKLIINKKEKPVEPEKPSTVKPPAAEPPKAETPEEPTSTTSPDNPNPDKKPEEYER